MNYTFEQLKNQVISLDFSKFEEIENKNIEELSEYVDSQLEIVKEEINREAQTLGISSIENLDTLFKNNNTLITSIKFPSLIPTLHLLNRIKEDLENLNL